MSQITMRQMIEAGVHFGHQTRYWNPKMAQYIFVRAIKFILSIWKNRSLVPRSARSGAPFGG